jgi:hypothetical protein
MFVSFHQNIGQNRDVRIANKTFANVVNFTYFGKIAVNGNIFTKKFNYVLNLGECLLAYN